MYKTPCVSEWKAESEKRNRHPLIAGTRSEKRTSLLFRPKGSVRFAPFPRKPKLHGHPPLWEGHKARYVRQQGKALAHVQT